jgi:hypothetical protein
MLRRPLPEDDQIRVSVTDESYEETVMRHLLSPSGLYAAAIVDAWSGGDGERLHQELTHAGTLRFEGVADAGECERRELLQAIVETIQCAGRLGSRDRCSVYIPMLRHLANPLGEHLVEFGHN